MQFINTNSSHLYNNPATVLVAMGFLGSSVVKNPSANAGDSGSIPGK